MSRRGPPNIKGMTSLKVDNLTWKTTEEDLRRQFEKFGEIGDVYIPKDRNKGNTKGFAFVRFYDRGDAEDALEGMDGRCIDSREIKIAMATASLAHHRNISREELFSRSTSRSPPPKVEDQEQTGDFEDNNAGNSMDTV